MLDFDAAMLELPLIAVLRGLKPVEALAIGQALFDAGFRLIEVPLNSPEPLTSIRLLSERFGAAALHPAEMINHVHKRDSRLVTQPAGVTIKR